MRDGPLWISLILGVLFFAGDTQDMMGVDWRQPIVDASLWVTAPFR